METRFGRQGPLAQTISFVCVLPLLGPGEYFHCRSFWGSQNSDIYIYIYIYICICMYIYIYTCRVILIMYLFIFRPLAIRIYTNSVVPCNHATCIARALQGYCLGRELPVRSAHRPFRFWAGRFGLFSSSGTALVEILTILHPEGRKLQNPKPKPSGARA